MKTFDEDQLLRRYNDLNKNSSSTAVLNIREYISLRFTAATQDLLIFASLSEHASELGI